MKGSLLLFLARLVDESMLISNISQAKERGEPVTPCGFCGRETLLIHTEEEESPACCGRVECIMKLGLDRLREK